VLFESRTYIELQGMNESFMNLNQVDPRASSDNYSTSQSNIQTQIQIITGDVVRDRSLEKLKQQAAGKAPPQAGIIARLRRNIGLLPPPQKEAVKEAIQRASRTLRVQPVKNTRVIEMACESTIPQVAADYLNIVADVYMEQNLEDRLKNAQHTGQWLADRLEQTRLKLGRSEDELQDYARRAGMNSTGQEETLTQARLKQLQSELSTVQTDRMNKQARYEMAMSLPPEGVPGSIDDGMLKLYIAKLTELREELAQAQATLLPSHPKIVRMQAAIAETERAMQIEKTKLLERLKNEYEGATARERMFLKTYQGQTRVAEKEADKAIEYGLRKREVDINQQMYNALLQQVAQAGMASAMLTNNIRVIGRAKPANAPFQPNPKLNLSLGLLTGFLAACGWVYVRQQMNRTIEQDCKAVAPGIPQLGEIPSARALKMSGNGAPKLASVLGLNGDIQTAWRAQSVELVTSQRAPSLHAESFRALLGSMIFRGRARQKSPLIVLTSPGPGEGKTTVASNMGIALAEAGRRVLLIDADLRKPRLHDVFDIANTWGMSDLLIEDTPVEQYPPEAFQRETAVRGLSLLPSGPVVRSITSLLCSPRMGQLLERLRSEFDAIILDTPPLFPFTDACILGNISDGVVLVVRCGVTYKDELRGGIERLQRAGVVILGTIVNDRDPGRRELKYYEAHAV